MDLEVLDSIVKDLKKIKSVCNSKFTIIESSIKENADICEQETKKKCDWEDLNVLHNQHNELKRDIQQKLLDIDHQVSENHTHMLHELDYLVKEYITKEDASSLVEASRHQLLHICEGILGKMEMDKADIAKRIEEYQKDLSRLEDQYKKDIEYIHSSVEKFLLKLEPALRDAIDNSERAKNKTITNQSRIHILEKKVERLLEGASN